MTDARVAVPLTTKSFMWVPEQGPGLESLLLTESHSGLTADGVVLGVADQSPFRLSYVITVDKTWHTRIVKLTMLGGLVRGLELHSDGAGHWCNIEGQAVDILDGCLDVDLSAAAFTNTLPIRRNKFKPGQGAEIEVAYVSVPDLEVKPARQRYTCLARHGNGGRYLYEGLSTGFRQEIEVDGEGFVTRYPQFSHRVWPRIA